jgi:tetratricopeptide (TPR) repeat protein/nucleoside-triphosphatase THEP1
MLAGRQACLRELLGAASEAARRGQGGLTLVGGEPGIGKTRLAADVASRLRVDGFTCAWVSCREDSGGPPYWPWSRLLTQLGAAAALARGDRETDPELARFLLFERVIEALRAAADPVPVLLVLDDLHWMDEPSLRLLAALRGELASSAIMVLGTYRDTEPSGGRLPAMLSPHRQLALGALSAEELGAAVLEVTGERVGTRLMALLHERTGGNPYFAAEVVRLLRAENRLGDRGESVPLPDTVRTVLERRLARLPFDAHVMMQVAALFGDPVRIPLVAKVCRSSAAEVLDQVDAARGARLLTGGGDDASGSGEYRFAHPLVRQTLVAQLGPADRMRWHLRIGQVLADRMDTGAAAPAEAARHLLAAAELGAPSAEAVRCAWVAAADAARRTAYEDAVSLLTSALAVIADTATDDPLQDRGALLCALGEAALAAGQPAKARDAYLEAARYARLRGQPDRLAAAALGLAGGADGFELDLLDPDRVSVLDEALRTLPDTDSPVRAALLARLSLALAFTGADERRRALSEAAVAMARRVSDPSVLAGALAVHCDAVAGPDHVSDRRAAATEIIALATAAGDRGRELLGRRLRVVALAEAGEWSSVDAEIEIYARAANRLGQSRLAWYVPLWRGARALMSGDLDTAAEHAAEHAAFAAGASGPNVELLGWVQRFVRLVGEDRADEIYDDFVKFLSLSPNEPAVVACSLAFLHALSGRPEDARRQLGRVVADPSMPIDSEWLPAVAQLSVAAVLAQHRGAAELAYRLLEPYTGLFCVEGILAGSWGSVDAHLGRLARFLGRADLAGTHFDVALLLDARAGAALAERTRRWAGDITSASFQPGELGGRWRRNGSVWTVEFCGRSVLLPDAKGLHDLALLLRRPGEQTHVSELAGGPVDRGDAGPLADRRAIAAYQHRLNQLADELSEAQEQADTCRAERLEWEREALLAELSATTGLGGRARRVPTETERMRKAVSNRIRHTIDRIIEVHPVLGRHLRASVRTGTYCGYQPEHPVTWQLTEN